MSVYVGSEDLLFKSETVSPEGGSLKKVLMGLRAQSSDCDVNASIWEQHLPTPCPQV